jgi:hypothetical protein
VERIKCDLQESVNLRGGSSTYTYTYQGSEGISAKSVLERTGPNDIVDNNRLGIKREQSSLEK